MSDKIITITAELTEQEAWAFAQLLKRLSFSDARSCAVDEEEAYLMIHASERLRDAFGLVGIAPR